MTEAPKTTIEQKQANAGRWRQWSLDRAIQIIGPTKDVAAVLDAAEAIFKWAAVDNANAKEST